MKKNPLSKTAAAWLFLQQFLDNEKKTRESSCIPYSQADDRGYVAAGRTAVRMLDLLSRKHALLVDALKQIRQMGYDSQAARATDTVLACIRVAEAAILEVEH